MTTPFNPRTIKARRKSADDLLQSWKEIAAYLRRTVRTVRRWEKEEGLPVHRHQHKKLGSVYAFRSEIDRWWADGAVRRDAASELARAPRLSTGAPTSINAEANEYFEKAMLALMARFELTPAQQLLQRALEVDPQFSEARAWLGFTYLLQLDTGYSNDTSLLYQADEELRRALTHNANCARALSGLGAVYLLQGRKELTPLQIQRARAVQATEFDASLWLASYYMLNGNYEAGIDLAREQLKRDPMLWPARQVLALLLVLDGDRAAGLRELQKVLDQDPQNHFALRTLAWAHLHELELGPAKAALDRLDASDGQNYHTRILRALLLALLGNTTEAMREADNEVLKYAAAIVWGAAEVVALYSVLKESDKALDWLDRAVRLVDERAAWLQRDPLLSGIRDHPRFSQIVESVAFRQQQRST